MSNTIQESPIENLYFFDDLTYHIKRICDIENRDRVELNSLLTSLWDLLLDSFKCVNHKKVDINIVNWEHACAALSFELKNHNKSYDFMISQGCNGEYAMTDLNNMFNQKYGCKLSQFTPNVRLAHLLDDPSDPFYSTFKLGVSKGEPLDDQIKRVSDEIILNYKSTGTKQRLATFDDCMGTGEGSKYVAKGVMKNLEGVVPFEMDMVAFIANESTMYRFQEMGFKTHLGVLFRGDVYPHDWSSDIYFLKDQFLSSAIRYTDGTSVPYMAGGWYDKIFEADPKRATELFYEIQSLLEKFDYLQPLEDL